MEGLNIAGILLGYLGVLVFGIVALVALGLLIARPVTRPPCNPAPCQPQ